MELDLARMLDRVNLNLDDLYKDRKFKRVTESQFEELEEKLLAKKEEIKMKMILDLSR